VLVDGLLNDNSPIGVLPKSIRPKVSKLNETNGPFGFLRVMSGVSETVENPAYDVREPTIGTT